MGIWLVNIVALAIYRLYFSPIAKFPGPKLAALTTWYEFYYEVIQKGRMSFHIQDLHKKYGEKTNWLSPCAVLGWSLVECMLIYLYSCLGPIIRISPEEIHVDVTLIGKRQVKTTWPQWFLSGINCESPYYILLFTLAVTVDDYTFWDTLYVKHPKSHKYDWLNGRFGNRHSIFTTNDPAHHRMRRAPLNPMWAWWEFENPFSFEFQSK